MANPSSGGAFLLGNDYTVTGVWTFTQDPVFPSSGSGPIITNPTIAGTVAGSATYTTPTLTTPVISAGLSASGSAANTFAGSTGTFLTSTGAVTIGPGAISLTGNVTFAANKNESVAAGTSAFDWSLGTGIFKTSTGAVTIGTGAVSITGVTTFNQATTPGFSLATGATNTGTMTVNGKTSGSLIITAADATAQAVTVTTAAQTVGAATATIPNFASVSDTFAFNTLAATFANKTLDVTTIFQPDKCLATQAFTSNQTLTNLTGLSWAVAASGVYYFECTVPLLTQTTNGGSQMAFKLTTATLTQVNFRVWQSTDTDNATLVSTSFTTTTDQATWFNQKATAFTYVKIQGMFTVGTAGSLAIQAAQNTSHADTTTFAGVSASMIRVS